MDEIAIDGRTLNCEQAAAVARAGLKVRLTPAARERAAASHRTAMSVAARRAVYGRTTGVGANRGVAVEDASNHGLRLLRSHAGGAGPLLPREQVRALLVVRLNQLAAGGAGVQPELLDVLAEALNRDSRPKVHRYGAVGTGDLTALAETALTLVGERPWDGEPMRSVQIETADALAFMSSNAATLGVAVLAQQDLQRLTRCALVIAALSFVAVDGNREAYASQVARATPQAGAGLVSRRLRGLLEGHTRAAARVQDPYAFRTLPQVHGPALDALAHLEAVLDSFINATAENPLVDVDAQDVVHHGAYHTSYVALALDGARLAVAQAATLGLARLSSLLDPAITKLSPFLAAGPTGSSGLLILEYTAASALGHLRSLAGPASIQTIVLSLGTEEDAGFTSLAAEMTREMVEPFRIILACELVAAVRALRMRGTHPSGASLHAAFQLAADHLPQETEDRDLAVDIETAAAVVNQIADTTVDAQGVLLGQDPIDHLPRRASGSHVTDPP